ncbi:MAG: 2,3,4,5-tetrahydropyridine-2,6-dicarboxylate N-succinyltransferase [Proteobacteria bacterium]|nr:2,3,4,5-tetrahydropyridine-2,6-dicarboxylate N-succinyltransferase [Pseudomonadota bacterium]
MMTQHHSSEVTKLASHIQELSLKVTEQPDYVMSATDIEDVNSVIKLLDSGTIRVAEKSHNMPLKDQLSSHHMDHSHEITVDDDTSWQVHSWIQKAITLYFKTRKMESVTIDGYFNYWDKIPLKSNYLAQNVRVVPPATARFGCYLAPGVVLMPSYVNIGSYVSTMTMVDTWATVGSCAQVGARVHLSGGVGLGGVLEPPGSRPVIIEDGVFIGSRSIVVEGARVKEQAVLAAQVSMTSSTYIYDTRHKPFKVYRGIVPERSVVVPGVREKVVDGGKIYLSCAYIIGERKESTDEKTSLNDVLREFSLSV